MPASRFQNLSALILAGGQGSRLGGRDKGLMPWRGQPVAAHLAALLRPLCGELLISCNRNQAEYARWADRLVSDAQPGYPGPLAGMLAGLAGCRDEHLLVVPCDLPHLDQELILALLKQAESAPDRPCLVRTGDDWQPLVCVLPKSGLDSLERFWLEGGRAPLRWLLSRAPGVLQLSAADPRLTNANEPADWVVSGRA